MTDLKDIRNIGIIAHIDAGKTTTTERILYYTQRIHRLGEVDDGSATMDWMEEEKKRGITITAAATTCFWKVGSSGTEDDEDIQINIIDTPGHIDFTVEVERSLRVLDGAVMIFSAVEGVESQSEAVWHQADKYRVPRLVYINKLDRIGADPWKCVQMIRERLAGRPLLLQYPVGIEDKVSGVCDLLLNKLIEWCPGSDGSEFSTEDVPHELMSDVETKKKELFEILSDEDDEFAELYIEGKDIPRNKLVSLIRKLTISDDFVPVFFGASLKNIGIQPLLDGVVEYLPSPLERPPVEGKNPYTDDKERRYAREDEPFCALVFKLQSDSHGTLAYLRVYSGKINPNVRVLNANTGIKERISHIYMMHANKNRSVQEAKAGDIVGVTGLKEVETGHTLTAVDAPIILESPKFPEPVISATIEPKTTADEAKLSLVLRRLSLDDPTFQVKVDSETGETLVSGMGELHLDVLTQRMEREFALKTRLTNPLVAFKETITNVVRQRGKFIKQTGGRGQYGDVELELRPLERGGGFRFKESVRDGSVPKEYWPAVRSGIEESMKVGMLAGFPVIDLEIRLIGGSYHSVDSSVVAFEVAASIAFKKAVGKAHPILLEPIMRLEIIIPPEYLGAVLDDLNARGGKILNLLGNEVRHTIIASCPLRKLFGYATVLRSMTQGRVVHIAKFDSYQKLSEEEQDLVLKKVRGY